MFVVPCRVSLGYFHANVSAWLSINKGGHSEYAHGQCLIHAMTLGYQTDNPSMLRKQECQQSYSPNNVNLCSLVKGSKHYTVCNSAAHCILTLEIFGQQVYTF